MTCVEQPIIQLGSTTTDVASSVPTQDRQIEHLRGYLLEFFEHFINDIGPGKEEVYIKYLRKCMDDPFNLMLEGSFHSTYLDFLDIDEGYPVAHRNERGKVYAIQLRPLKNNRLLVGCGNNPTSVCYHEPVDMVHWVDCCRENFKENQRWGELLINQKYQENKFGITHFHDGYDTIDPNITMNPTIIAHFGDTALPFIPSNQYTTIEFEGIGLEGSEHFSSQISRLKVEII